MIFNGVLPIQISPALRHHCLFSETVHLSSRALGSFRGQLQLPGSPMWYTDPRQLPATSPLYSLELVCRLCSPSVASRFAAMAPPRSLDLRTFWLHTGHSPPSNPLQWLGGSQTHTWSLRQQYGSNSSSYIRLRGSDTVPTQELAGHK